MMSSFDKNQLKSYYGEINDLLLCSKKRKKKILDELENDINEYLNAEGEVTIDNIKGVFGTPEEIAQSFMSGLSIGEIKKKTSVRKYILLFLLIVLLIYLAFVVISLIDVHTEAHGYMEQGIMFIDTHFKGGTVL